jgi:hypothetical protein
MNHPDEVVLRNLSRVERHRTSTKRKVTSGLTFASLKGQECITKFLPGIAVMAQSHFPLGHLTNFERCRWDFQMIIAYNVALISAISSLPHRITQP